MQSNSRVSSLMSAFPPCTFSKAVEPAGLPELESSVPHAYPPNFITISTPSIICPARPDTFEVDFARLDAMNLKLDKLQACVCRAYSVLREAILCEKDEGIIASVALNYAKAVKRYHKKLRKLDKFFSEIKADRN